MEEICKALFDATPGSGWKKRGSVARFFGYEDAKFMVFLMETHGVSLADQVVMLARIDPDISIPWAALRWELGGLGIKQSAIEARIHEAKEFYRR